MPPRPRPPLLSGLADGHRPALGLAALLVLLEATLELARPWPLQFVVDHVLGDRPLPSWADALEGVPVPVLAAGAAAAVVLLTGLGGLAGTVASVLVGRSAERIGLSLRAGLVARLLSHPTSFFRRHRSTELVDRVTSDVQRVEDAVVAWWEVAVPEAVVLVGTLAVLVLVDPWLALVATAVCPVLAVTIVRQRRAVRAVHERAREQEGRLAQQAGDLVRNVRVVQAFGQERLAGARFGVANRRAHDVNVQAVGVEARWSPLVDLVLGLGGAGVLVVGTVRVDAGAMTTGTLVVALSYVAGLYTPLRSLSSLAATLARAEASRARVAEVLAPAPLPRPPAPIAPTGRPVATDVVPDAGAQLDHVGFAYASHPVLDDVSLVFARGRTTALTGPSGAGKSTVLNLLLCFERPDRGRVLVDGVDVADRTPEAVRDALSYVPQESWFFDDTLRANIAFGAPDATDEEVEAAARAAHVLEFALRLPQGLDTGVGESGLLLSAGERKRVSIARAVLRQVPVMLLDEPTAGLDDRSADAVLAAVSACAAGRTVVVVTHDPRVATWADDVVDLPASTGAASNFLRVPVLGGR